MKKILIFGATSLIAQHCARLWATEGNALYLVGRNQQQLAGIAADLKIRGAATVYSQVLDLNETSGLEALYDEAMIQLGDIDIALIAHGSLPDQDRCQNDLALTLQEIQNNALTTISVLSMLANRFEKKQSGIIAVITSVAGDRGKSSNYVYGACKAMVSVFSEGLRHRLFKSNVSVLTIKPGFVSTPMTQNFKKGILWAQPETVARQITRAIDKRKEIIYTPFFWKYIMILIKMIPAGIFKRLKL